MEDTVSCVCISDLNMYIETKLSSCCVVVQTLPLLRIMTLANGTTMMTATSHRQQKRGSWYVHVHMYMCALIINNPDILLCYATDGVSVCSVLPSSNRRSSRETQHLR